MRVQHWSTILIIVWITFADIAQADLAPDSIVYPAASNLVNKRRQLATLRSSIIAGNFENDGDNSFSTSNASVNANLTGLDVNLAKYMLSPSSPQNASSDMYQVESTISQKGDAKSGSIEPSLYGSPASKTSASIDYISYGLNLLTASQDGPLAFSDLQNLTRNRNQIGRNTMKLGYDASQAIQDVLTTISIAAKMANYSENAFEWVGFVDEWAGPLGTALQLAGNGLDQGMAIYDYHRSRISREQFIAKSSGVASGAGSIFVGAIIGSCFEPGGGTVLGATIGGVIAVPAAELTNGVVDQHYLSLRQGRYNTFEKAVYLAYGLQPPMTN